MSLPRLNQTYKNMRRMQRIAAVFARHGFAHFVESVGLAKLLPAAWKAEAPASRLSPAERLCVAFEELGPAFVKLGQTLASRPDLVTPPVAEVFERLQDDARTVPIGEIRGLVEGELEGTIESLFADFDPQPLAAASIAQVHRATLHSGESAVVKVQRPGVERAVETDLSILFLAAKLAEHYLPELARYQPVLIVEEFARTVKTATDFIEEGHAVDAIAANFAGQDDVVIPRVFWELSSKRVLTMERIEGIPLRDVDRLKAEGYDLPRIVRTGVDAFFRQLFVHRLFHADLHGGNVLVLPENRIAFVDFGEVGRLGSNAQASVANIFVSLLSKDFGSVAREYMELGTIGGSVDLPRFADDLEKLLGPMFGRKIRDVKFAEILSRAAGIAAEHRIRLPRELVLVGRVIVSMEESVRRLDPEFDILDRGGSFAADLAREKFRPERLAKELVWNLKDLSELSKMLPAQIKYLVQKLSSDHLSFHVGVEHLASGIEEAGRGRNRVAYAIVAAGLFAGSSLLAVAGRGPHVLGLPLPALLGYLAAAGFCFALLASALRMRKF